MRVINTEIVEVEAYEVTLVDIAELQALIRISWNFLFAGRTPSNENGS